jgi:hypothetical protein
MNWKFNTVRVCYATEVCFLDESQRGAEQGLRRVHVTIILLKRMEYKEMYSTVIQRLNTRIKQYFTTLSHTKRI